MHIPCGRSETIASWRRYNGGKCRSLAGLGMTGPFVRDDGGVRVDRMIYACIRPASFATRTSARTRPSSTFPSAAASRSTRRRGRLWVVCRKCERWNLSPIDERWEAIEECERLFRDTRLRVSTDNIGLARVPDGLELVRIGSPLRPEMAAWRYGDQFGRRRRKNLCSPARRRCRGGVRHRWPGDRHHCGGRLGTLERREHGAQPVSTASRSSAHRDSRSGGSRRHSAQATRAKRRSFRTAMVGRCVSRSRPGSRKAFSACPRGGRRR